jgi:hypothetical protein
MRRRDDLHPFGRPATAAERDKLSRALGRWRSVAGFGRILRRSLRPSGDHVLDHPGTTHYREAMTALAIAEATGAELLRLGEDPPDFELSTAGRVTRCEAVEVLPAGRERGRELKAARCLSPATRRKPQFVGEDEFLPTAGALAKLVAEVNKKAKKPYPPGLILCAYINLGFLADARAFEQGIAAAVAGGFPTFSEVWVLYRGAVTRFAPP